MYKHAKDDGLERLLTLEEAAEILQCTTRTVRSLVNSRKLPCVRLLRKSLRFRPSDIREWVAKANRGLV